MNLKKYLHIFVLATVTAALLTGCTLKRPDELINDIAPLAPEAASSALNPNDYVNADGTVKIVKLVTDAYGLPPDAALPPAQDSATLRVEPASQQVEIGNSTTAEISVADVSNLAAVDLEIRFDPALVQATDHDPAKDGVQIAPGEFLTADFVVRNTVDNIAGIIRYTVTQVAPNPAKSGTGILAVIFLKGIAPGVSPITFEVAQLASGDAQEITAITVRGEVVVTQPGAATATATVPGATPITTEPTATSTPVILSGSTPNAVLTPTPAPDAAPPVAEVQATLIVPDTPTPTPTATFTPVPPPQALIIDQPLVPIPPNATFGQCYRVTPDDTIETIAMLFGTTPQAINLANDLYPPYTVQRYQHIFVPQFLGQGPNVVQLQPGDTLNTIAAACNLPVTMLARVNLLEIDKLPSGADTILQTETLGLRALIIPIPPYPPPARYQYPRGPIPVIPNQNPYPMQKNHPLWPYN